MQIRGVTIAVLLVFALFVVIAAALGLVRWRLPIYYSSGSAGVRAQKISSLKVGTATARADNEKDVGGSYPAGRDRAQRGLAARPRGGA